MSDETTALIQEFNPELIRKGNPFENWYNICCANADKNNAQLEYWLKNPPNSVCESFISKVVMHYIPTLRVATWA